MTVALATVMQDVVNDKPLDIGKDTERIEDLQNKIARRKHIQKMLKSLHEEYAKAQKMLEVCI